MQDRTERRDDPRDDGEDDARRPDPSRKRMPPAGPHADPDLTNEDATPGTGSLPERKDTIDPAGG